MSPLRFPVFKRCPADWLSARRTFRIFAFCALVGLVAGLGAAGFCALLELAKHVFLDLGAGFRPPGAVGEADLFSPGSGPLVRWLLCLIPALGGLASGILVFALAPEAEGHGTDAAIDAYHRRDGLIRTRVPFVKTIASALTIGTGGSAGTEGPISQIGAGFGSLLARVFSLSLKERRILLAAGMGAGIGAIFRTPLAGALFAAEVLYREMDFEYEVMAPSILASVVGYSVFAMFFGFQPLFATPAFAFRDPRELLPYTLLAVAAALGARFFTFFFYRVRDAFRAMSVPRAVKPMLGGLITGACGFFLPEALGTGYGVIQGALSGESGIWSHGFGGSPALALAVFALAKMLTTSATVASGGSGGIFGPSVVVGGALGASAGLALDALMPGFISAPGAFAMVGMAGFFAAAARTPISTVIMVSEMTGNYELLVPSMWVSMLAFLLTSGAGSLYEKQEKSRADSTLHRGAMMRSVLEHLFVREAEALRPAAQLTMVPADMPLPELLKRFDETGLASLPMADAQGRLSGQLDLDAVRQTLSAAELDESAFTARDLALPPVTLVPDNTLFFALHQLAETGRRCFFVVDASGRAVDLFGEADVTALCERQIDRALHEDERPLAASVFRRWMGDILAGGRAAKAPPSPGETGRGAPKR